jgi:hypothetical protein
MWVSKNLPLSCFVTFSSISFVSLINNNIYFFLFSAFTVLIAITFPFFGGLLGFFGGFAFAPTTYFVSHLIL